MPDVMRKNHTSDGTRITALPFHAQRAHPITLAVPDMPVFPVLSCMATCVLYFLWCGCSMDSAALLCADIHAA